MDVEKIINMVYEYKCLWDQSDTRYHARDHQRKAWQEISEELKIPVDELKKKWKGLRDMFGKELKKASNKKSGVADTKLKSKWPHFKQLMFLVGTMTRRDVRDSVAEICEVSVENSLDGEASTECASSPHYYIEQINEQTGKSLKRKARSTDDERLLELGKESLQFANDPDAQFLVSLLPFLKDVPKRRKLMVRSKLQQVLMDEQNETSSVAKLEYCSD